MKKELQLASENAIIKVTIQATIVDKRLVSYELERTVNNITEGLRA